MSDVYDVVSAYVHRMSEEEIKSMDFYPNRYETLEQFRSNFLSYLERFSMVEAFYSLWHLKFFNT